MKLYIKEINTCKDCPHYVGQVKKYYTRQYTYVPHVCLLSERRVFSRREEQDKGREDLMLTCRLEGVNKNVVRPNKELLGGKS